MKIAMIGQKGIPSRSGGVEVHVEEIAKRLVENDLNVNVYCRKSYCNEIYCSTGGITEYKGIHITYTPYIKSKHLDAITHTFTSTIRALIAGCDIFHYHALGPSTLAFIPRIFGKKVVCTVHGLDWQRGKWGKFASAYLKFGEYATAKFANRTISVSQNLLQYYKKKYNVDAEYIPNGVEKPRIEAPQIIKEKFGLEKDGYILFLARLVREKGAHYLVEAYNKLHTDRKLVIAGGASHSNRYVEELHALIKGNGNIILTGFVEGKELNELYSNAYIYVLPSDVEGLPISLLEAMSYGNCCLTSDIPENALVIEEMGYKFEKSNVNDLTTKIDMLLKEPYKIERVKKNVGSFILSKYNWGEICSKTYGVYKQLFFEEKRKEDVSV